MSLTNLNNQIYPLSLDGLQIIEADELYIGGNKYTPTDLTGHVPYTGATQDVDLNIHTISSETNPTINDHLTRKGWIDTNFVNKAGDTMSGDLNISYGSKLSKLTNNMLYLGGTQNGRRYLLESNENEQFTIQKQRPDTGTYETKFYINAEGRTVINSDRLYIGQDYFLTPTTANYLSTISSNVQTQLDDRYVKSYIDTMESNLATQINNTNVNLANNYYNKTTSDGRYIQYNASNAVLTNEMLLYTAGDANRGFVLRANNADGADFSTTNGDIITWFGLGIVDKTSLTRKIYFDARDGSMGLKGGLNFDGNILSKTLVGYLSDLTSSPQQQINSLTNNLANNYYNKTFINNNFYSQLYITTHYYDINSIDSKFTDYYTSSQIDTILTDYYTKTQIDTTLSNYYTKTQTDDKYVNLTTAQTITGNKIFQSSDGIVSHNFNGATTLKLKNYVSGYLFQPVLNFNGGYDALGTPFTSIESLSEKGITPGAGIIKINPGYQYPIEIYGHTFIKNKNLYIDNGYSVFVGPTENNSFRMHHLSSNDSYLDYGSGNLYIRHNDGSGNVIQSAFLASDGKWIISASGGLSLDRFNIVGGLNLQNISPYDGTNKITFTHNYSAGSAECQNYTWLNGSQSAISWRWSPSGANPNSYQNILTLSDDTGGNRQITANGLLTCIKENISGCTVANTDDRSFKISGYGHVQITHPTNNSINRLFITESGNVGIGTDEFPNVKLKIQSDDFIGVRINRTVDLPLFGSGLEFTLADKSYCRVFGGSLGAAGGYACMDPLLSNGTFRSDNGWSESMLSMYENRSVFRNQVISNSYFISSGLQTGGGIQWTGDIPEAMWKCCIIGNYRLGFQRDSTNWTTQAYIDINGQYWPPSDERLKEDIKPLNTSNSLEKILAIKPVSWRFKNSPFDETKRSIGFISQQVEEVNPYSISTWTEEQKSDDSIKHLSYQDLGVHNIGATQEIYKIVQEQQMMINDLNDKINRLESIIKEQNETLINIVEYISSKK